MFGLKNVHFIGKLYCPVLMLVARGPIHPKKADESYLGKNLMELEKIFWLNHYKKVFLHPL